MKPFKFRNLSLHYKIHFAHSLVFVLIFAIGSMIIFYVQKQSIETGIEDGLKNTTSALLNMVNTAAKMTVKNYLRAVAEKNLDIVQDFYSQYEQGKLTEQEAKSKATRVLFSQHVGNTGYIYCIDSEGIVVVHPKPGMLGTDVANFGFVKEQIRKKEGYIEYNWKNPNETLERPKALYMSYFKPWDWIISVSSYREEFRDMVNLSDFRENIISHRFGKTGYAFVVGYDGVSLIHPYKDVEGKSFLDAKDARGRKFIAEMCRKKNGKIIYPWKNPGETDAREKLTIFGDISEFNWIVGASVYLDELYAPLNTFRNLMAVTIIISILLVFPITLWSSSLITRPIKSLMANFAIGAAGDLSVRMKIRSEDEIGQLARYFNNFMENLEAFAKKLSESEKKYRSLFENAVEGIFQSVPGGGYLSVNPAFAKIFGYDSPDEVISCVTDIGKQLYVNAEERQELIQTLNKKGKVRGFETQLYRKDKSIMWGSIYARKVCDNNHEDMKYYEGSFIDITNRKETELELKQYQEHLEEIVEKRTMELKIANEKLKTEIEDRIKAENALRKSEQKLYNIIDFLPDGIIVIDKDGKVISWNKAVEKMTGIKNIDIIGKGNYEYAIPFYGERRPILIDLAKIPNEEFEKKYPQIARQEGVLTGESFTPNLPGGGAYLFATASALYDSEGNIEGAIELIRDITDRKKSEDKLKKALIETCIARKAAEEATQKIMKSINYAKMIQRSLLANMDVVKTYMPKSFFIWEPRDIVGGDIFYTDSFENGFIVAVIDCTGHGVPGAFLTMIASTALKRITKDEGCHDPSQILKRLNYIVKTTLQQDKVYASSDDGMDIGIARVTTIDKSSGIADFLVFAGARISLYCVCNDKVDVIKGDKQSIGYRRSELDFNFTNHTIQIEKGMNFYLTTDGFTDQLGEEHRFGFGITRFKKLLHEISNEPFEKQRSMLIQAFEEYKGKRERRDDMTLVGFGF